MNEAMTESNVRVEVVRVIEACPEDIIYDNLVDSVTANLDVSEWRVTTALSELDDKGYLSYYEKNGVWYCCLTI